MLTQDTVDRLQATSGGDFPVLSVYVGLRPGEQRGVAARLKDLLAPIRQRAESLPRSAAMSVREDVAAIIEMAERIALEGGKGAAVFRCSGTGLAEFVPLPEYVRDRAVLDVRVYVRPLEAIREYFQRFCAVVIDRRKASIFKFYMGELETWEEMHEEEIRKANYGGFDGREERHVRSHAEEVANRHYRTTATRLVQLMDEKPGFDLLLIGGPQEHVEGLKAVLRPDLAKLLAGSFTIDPHTMTPALVRDHCLRSAAEYAELRERQMVSDLFDAAGAGQRATIGIDGVLGAVNQRAVDTLFVEGGESVTGYQCTDCDWIVLDSGGLCPACGESTRPVPDVLDALAAAVRASAGTVQHIMADTPLRQHEIGATLRFPVTVSV